jgi:membrane protein implicated in regulation of membrane protease activity
MIWLYIASLIFGAVFVVPMVLGGFDFDTDIGDIDVDAGGVGDLDMDVDASGISGAVGDFVGSLLNFRSSVLGSTFFGLSGMIFTVLDTNVVATLIAALSLGLIAAAANSSITTFVLGHQQSSHVTLSEVQGMSAEVMLPIAEDRRGRVRAQIAGQTEYFTALPYKPGYSFEPGETVVVIEIDGGLAKVASLRELGT